MLKDVGGQVGGDILVRALGIDFILNDIVWVVRWAFKKVVFWCCWVGIFVISYYLAPKTLLEVVGVKSVNGFWHILLTIGYGLSFSFIFTAWIRHMAEELKYGCIYSNSLNKKARQLYEDDLEIWNKICSGELPDNWNQIQELPEEVAESLVVLLNDKHDSGLSVDDSKNKVEFPNLKYLTGKSGQYLRDLKCAHLNMPVLTYVEISSMRSLEFTNVYCIKMPIQTRENIRQVLRG